MSQCSKISNSDIISRCNSLKSCVNLLQESHQNMCLSILDLNFSNSPAMYV